MSLSVSDKYIQRALRLNRVSVGEGIKGKRILEKAHDKIKTILKHYLDTNPNFSSLNKAEAEIAAVLRQFYGDSFLKKIKADAATIVQLETTWNFEAISGAVGRNVDTSDWAKAASKAWRTPYSGRTFEQWFKRAGATDTRKIKKTLRGAFVSGMSVEETTRLVEGILGKSEKNIRTLVRSSLLHSSAHARRAMFEANSDIIKGVIWNSTLDIRTTPHICGIRDQRKYDMDKNPVGHSLPWGAGPGAIHFNCRSIEIPDIEGVDVMGHRPAIDAGHNYKRGDNITNRGTVRKPTKRNREKGIFEIDHLTNQSRYEAWLKRQPLDFVADALQSIERAKAFKKGTLLRTLTDYPLGRPLTIERL